MTGSLPPEDPRDALIREQAALIAGLSAQVTDLSAQLAELTGLVRELRGQLEAARRAASRNPGNSSMPPSSDDLPGGKAPAPRAKLGSGRRPGKQPGAPGAHLAWPETPDETVALFPEGSCPCGLDLTGAADLGVVASRQVIDVPLAAATVTQYDEHAVRCGCEKVHESAAVPGAGRPGTVAWGLNVQALAVFLRGPRFSGQGSNRILAGKDGIECRGNRSITLRSSRSRPSGKWSTPRRRGRLPRWRGNSILTIPLSGSG